MANDDKLIEAIILSGKHAGHWDDNLSEQVREGRTTKLVLDIPSLLEAIKQAFADETGLTKLMQDMTNVQARIEQEMIRLGLSSTPAKTSIKADFSKGKLDGLMTGQEWYNRFEKELERITNVDVSDFAYMGAAKRAAGVEQ